VKNYDNRIGPFKNHWEVLAMFLNDFAISYAGEDKSYADEIYKRIKEKAQSYSIFFAPYEKDILVGQDGEALFEILFSMCKEVIVLLSENYKHKKWTRYEWDIILERNKENRFIPLRLDDVKILGMPSSIIYETITEGNYDQIADLCIRKLLLFEKQNDIHRDTEYEKIFKAITHSEGELDKAFQLVVDDRKRTPLSDISYPEGNYKIKYSIKSEQWLRFSVINRREIRISLPAGLSKDEVRYNVTHCIVSDFNKNKPDAISVLVYCRDDVLFDIDGMYNVARAVFAPYGKWERAQEGFAYNLPVDKFAFTIDFYEGYFWNVQG
jgi:hypothetical protein